VPANVVKMAYDISTWGEDILKLKVWRDGLQYQYARARYMFVCVKVAVQRMRISDCIMVSKGRIRTTTKSQSVTSTPHKHTYSYNPPNFERNFCFSLTSTPPHVPQHHADIVFECLVVA
jgi:hypothetical protein